MYYNMICFSDKYQQVLETGKTYSDEIIPPSLVEKYNDYIDNAPDRILIVNYDGEYLEVNNAVTKITGFSEDDVIGKRIGEVFALLGDLGPKDLLNQVKDNRNTWWNYIC